MKWEPYIRWEHYYRHTCFQISKKLDLFLLVYLTTDSTHIICLHLSLFSYNIYFYNDFPYLPGAIVVVWLLNLQQHVQSVSITTKVAGSNPTHGEVYSIQHYVIKFVSDLRQVGCFFQDAPVSSTNKTDTI